MKGYAGLILDIDLSTQKIGTIDTRHYADTYLGGRGIGVKILYDRLTAGADPLGPENHLVFTTGPLTGTAAPSSGRTDVVTLSPETGLLGGGNAGGFWGPELKSAGYDGIVVHGAAKRPVYLEIYNEHVTLKDAGELWGHDVYQTLESLRRDDPELQVACIGPAGENRVNLAGIAFNYRNYAARCGLGAVMGAKNLKAIAVRGTKGVAIHDPQALLATALQIQDRQKTMPLRSEARDWHWKLFQSLEDDGKAFYGNYETSAWERRDEAREELKKYIEQHDLRLETCFGCPIRCWATFSVSEGETAPVIACQGTLPSLSYFLKIADPAALWRLYVQCQKLGLDAGGVSAVVAFAMALFEHGVIDERDIGGIALRWGDADAAAQIITRIAHREGLGDILADGVKKAAERLGEPAKKHAVFGKGGLEVWLMETRPFKGAALAGAVSDAGSPNRTTYAFPDFYFRSMTKQAKMVAKNITGDEEAADPGYYEAKPKMVVFYENVHILSDSVGVCSIPFQPAGLELWRRALNATTGRDGQVKDLMQAAERIRNVERLFNLREGLTRDDDLLPDKLFDEALTDGPWKGAVLDRDRFEAMKSAYYSLRGWDNDGRPKPQTLDTLGLAIES